jgi:hypothetical protein
MRADWRWAVMTSGTVGGIAHGLRAVLRDSLDPARSRPAAGSAVVEHRVQLRGA